MKIDALLRLLTFILLLLMGVAAFAEDVPDEASGPAGSSDAQTGVPTPAQPTSVEPKAAEPAKPLTLSPAPIPQAPVVTPEDVRLETHEESSHSKRMRSVQFGLGFFNFNYHEELPVHLKSTENNVIPDLNITLNKVSEKGCFVRAIFDMGVGNTNYVGTDSAGNPLTAQTQNLMLNAEIDFGMPFYKGESGSVSGYLGLGDSFWRRDLSAYREEYSWLFLPVGVRYETTLRPAVDVAVDLALKIPFHGSIEAYLSDISPSYSNGSGLLGTDRIGVRLQVPVTFHTEGSVHWVVTPWFEYSGFTRGSDFPVEDNNGNPIVVDGAAQVAHEPASQAYRFGLNAAALVRF